MVITISTCCFIIWFLRSPTTFFFTCNIFMFFFFKYFALFLCKFMSVCSDFIFHLCKILKCIPLNKPLWEY